MNVSKFAWKLPWQTCQSEGGYHQAAWAYICLQSLFYTHVISCFKLSSFQFYCGWVLVNLTPKISQFLTLVSQAWHLLWCIQSYQSIHWSMLCVNIITNIGSFFVAKGIGASHSKVKFQGKNEGRKVAGLFVPTISKALLGMFIYLFVVLVQLLSCVWLLATPWTAARQAPLSSTISWSWLKFLSIELVMLSIHLILCHPLLLFPSGFFPMSRLFPSGGQSIRASATALPMNIQGWFPLELTGLISLHSKGLPRVFSSTPVWKHQFFGTQPSSSSILGGFITSLSYKSPFTMTRLWSMKGIFIYTWFHFTFITLHILTDLEFQLLAKVTKLLVRNPWVKPSMSDSVIYCDSEIHALI